MGLNFSEEARVPSKWIIAERQSDNLLEHLCLLRGLNVQNLEPNYATQLHDPYLLPDMAKAVELIQQAKKEQWPTVIFGDYDADGTPAAAVLATACKRLDIPFTVVLPTRAEGYGLSRTAVEKLPAATKLLITVDTGVTAVDEIALAKEKGMRVIVLDHHLPKETLPSADALIDPFVPDSQYPFTGLCGCALAYKLVVALGKVFPNEITEAFQKWLLDLVAISTVADMMPLVDENRTLVYYGLQVLRHNRRPGVRALLEQAGLAPESISAGNLGYSIGPRLNAAGRLGDNRPAYELLVAEAYPEAEKWATEIEKANWKRQQLVDSVLTSVEEVVFAQNSPDDRLLVVIGEDWPSGVLGLAAGKLANKYFRPSIVLSKKGGLLTGSARSTGNYSIVDGLTSQEKLLDRFGGHAQAAGLGLEADNAEQFIAGLKAHALQHIAAEDLVPTYAVDGILRPNELVLETAETLEKLQPFGLQNSQPLFVIEGLTLGEPKALGAKGEHLKFKAKKGAAQLDVIGFGIAKRFAENPAPTADVLGYLEKNTWQNRSTLQLRLVDWR